MLQRRLVRVLSAAALCLAVTACKKENKDDAQQQLPPGHPPVGQGGQGAMPAAGGPGAITGKVVETMDSGGYTYVQVEGGGQKIWAAAPQFSAKVGDTVTVPPGAPMQNYHSKTLNRTFDVVYFVGGVTVGGAAAPAAGAASQPAAGAASQPAAGAASQPAAGAAPAGGEVDLSNIKKADGGNTVGEVFAKKGDLNGKEVSVRGKVVKFTAGVMGKNWVHIRDGSGESGANDLTVTTDANANVGDTVLIKGTLKTDQDYGYGYKYDVIIDGATVTAE